MPCNSSELCQISCPTRPGYAIYSSNISASVTFAETGEPWTYCASIAPTWSYGAGSLGTLKNEFAESKGSDAAITAIDNPRLFARRLGIEFALGVDVGRDIEDNYMMELLNREFTRRVLDQSKNFFRSRR